MPDEVLRSAVEPFFTTKEPGKGSGLGLSQVYGTMQQSNGAMEIESRVGVGTVVRLFLPRAPAEPAVFEAARAPAAAGAIGGRVLLVDDDSGVREITGQMLRQCGFAVTEVASGQAALDALGRGEAYDLVVIDIAMPGLSGVETVARARRDRPGLPVLYITGYAETGGNPDADGETLLKKPFRLHELQSAVRHALERRPETGPAPPTDARPASSAGIDPG
jgi:CheY-like chemotaxis protein